MSKQTNKQIETDAKRPDQVLKSLTQGFQWSRQHSYVVIGAIVLFFAVGGGVAIYDYVSKQKESSLQEKYYALERIILEKKKVVAESAKSNPKSKDKEPIKSVPVKEDFDKDYASTVADLETLAGQHPESRAGQMAALEGAELLNEFGKKQQALDLLNKLGSVKTSALLTGLVIKQKGNLQADLGQCKEAISTWEQIVKSDSFEFLRADVKLRQALCYENIKDLVQAEKIYLELSQKSNEDQDQTISKEAEKYLRLLNMKKGS